MNTIIIPSDGGSIDVMEREGSVQRLRLRADAASDLRCWFYFVADSSSDQPLELRIVNANEATFKGAFNDYRAMCWPVPEGLEEERALRLALREGTLTRAETRLEGDALLIQHRPIRGVKRIAYAYFAPFGASPLEDFLATSALSPRVSRTSFGKSCEGRLIQGLRIGEPSATAKIVWIVARQHAGETMATWWCKGFVEQVLASPLDDACLFVVPNCNPDGSALGHQRMNARGVDLNRQWGQPTADASELIGIRKAMVETGVDFLLDVHGEESLPFAFVMPARGVPSHDAPRAAIYEAFAAMLLQRNPDFQVKVGYPFAGPGKANLTICSSWCAETFGAAAWTLEQPYKDAANHPDPALGWTPARSERLGGDCWAVLRELIGKKPPRT